MSDILASASGTCILFSMVALYFGSPLWAGILAVAGVMFFVDMLVADRIESKKNKGE